MNVVLSICCPVYSGSTLLGLSLQKHFRQARFWGEINRFDVSFNRFRESDKDFRSSLTRTSELFAGLGLTSDPFWNQYFQSTSWPDLVRRLLAEFPSGDISIGIEDSKFSDWLNLFGAELKDGLPNVRHVLIILYRDPYEWLLSLRRTHPGYPVSDALELYISEYSSYLQTASTLGLPIFFLSHERFTRNPSSALDFFLRQLNNMNLRVEFKSLSEQALLNNPVAIGGNPKAYLADAAYLGTYLTVNSSRLHLGQEDAALSYFNKLNFCKDAQSFVDLFEYLAIKPKRSRDPNAVANLLLMLDSREKRRHCTSREAWEPVENVKALLQTFSEYDCALVTEPEMLYCIRELISRH